MDSRKLFFLGVLVVLILGAGLIMNGYNSLVFGQENVKKAWADVQTQYQRRIDLIGNVVETAKGSAKFEQQTLTAIVDARSAWAKASSSGTLNDQVKATQEATPLINDAVSRLLVTVEAYPQLSSTQAFRDVITELEGTENRVAVSRRDFNAAVQDYNLKVRQFPSSISATLFHFTSTESFQADAGASQAPKVDFSK